MDTAAVESLTSNSVENIVADIPPKEVVEEVGGTDEVNSVKELNDKGDSEKELSWEKITAEFVAEDDDVVKEEDNQNQVETAKVEPESEKILDTVITEVIGEKTVTESEADVDSTESELKAESDNAKPVQEAENIAPVQETENNEPVQETENIAPVQEKEDKENGEEVAQQVVQEGVGSTVDEVSAEAVPVDEVEEETSSSQPEAEIPEKSKETVVEITELKSDEELTSDLTESVGDIEYTVVEAEEVETNEIIEEHLAQTNSSEQVTETVVIINPDQTETQITIEQLSEDEKTDDNSQSYTEEIYLVTKESEHVDDPSPVVEEKPKPKKQRGRKPIADIPLHVLGRDISKPTEGVSNGGRTMPKPRLGVKVPYRNLTSQIVSKQEIEKEIMERFKLKQEQHATQSGDILFARKLTQRLAKKLIPTDKEKTIEKQETKPEAGGSVEKSEIKNNSDLIAILEGEGDDIELTKRKEEAKKELAKKSEKEIALEQLKELPGKPTKIIKDEKRKEDEKKVTSPQKDNPKARPQLAPSPQKKDERKNQVDVEPRLKTGMVIKTYTRKRKSTEEPILPPKKSAVSTPSAKQEDGATSGGSVYVTKSSRIIKRKVIWDPDETPSKSPLKSPKLEPGAKSPPAKPAEKKEVEKNQKTVEKKEIEKNQEKKVASPVKKVVVPTKSSPVKKPKRLTEVDRLLMDEGAVNMLYDVKTNDDSAPDKLKKKNNKNVISLDKAHKELMSKTNMLKNDLQQNTSVQKSLRKKEVASPPKKEVKKETTPTAITRKKSKDSVRSSVHSPPSSPPYNAAEASRIIRRHSSSSFSSDDDLTEENGEEKTSKKKAAAVGESAKKKVRKSSDAKPPKEKDVVKNNNNTVNEGKVNHVDKNVGKYESFTVTKKNKLVSIKLQNVEDKCYLTEQVLKDLASCLKEYGKDDDCHVISITSNSNESFCEGLDYSLLTADEDGVRKKKAAEVANLVKEFLRCLLNFPKVVVAGVQGDCVGLGVTMLPLFDMVIASDTSTFSAPYATLGCVPEAGFLLAVPYLSSNGLASELLFTSQIIKADDAFRRGLVTRLCWPEKYQQELKNMLSEVVNQPLQSILATKQQLRQNILQSTESALNSISKVLVESWTSPECQKNFSK